MQSVGAQIERFLAPVEPGNLLLMGYLDDLPIVSAPGCFRSVKPNVVDLILPPMLARYRISGWEVVCLCLADFLPNISSTTTVAPPSGLWVFVAGRLTNARHFLFFGTARVRSRQARRATDRSGFDPMLVLL